MILVCVVGTASLVLNLTGALDQDRPQQEVPILADVVARSRIILEHQSDIYKKTQALHKVVAAHPDGKPRPEDKREAFKLAQDMQNAVRDVTKIIDIFEKEGAAVAFPEVFIQIRKDLLLVQRRLGDGDTGPGTQAIQQDIVETFRELVLAATRTR